MWARIALVRLLIGLVPIEGVVAEATVVSYPPRTVPA